MRSLDLSPLMRSSIGFDQINRLFEAAARSDGGEPTFPPYNIEKAGDDDYRISMALAGFSENDLDITLHEGVLIVSGKAKQEEEERNFLYRGIAQRAFERRFRLADTIKVEDAIFENGMLHIDLKREVPEHMKPRKIEIAKGVSSKAIESRDKAVDKDAA